MNAKGEFLITRRSPGISLGGLWQTTGGSATTGDDSLSAALRETKEETGVTLVPANGILFNHRRDDYRPMPGGLNDTGGGWIDAWLFRQEIADDEIVLQPEETCDAMWATAETIRQMFKDGTFVPSRLHPYFEDLVAYCSQTDHCKKVHE